ncbi:hypothetical protein [Prevotella pallens]|jgi:hypothetical protein|uniref:hypothetical protein n=1 Tax=Prevotella pallens TaxID=60133 RepID=UPI001CB33D43|nr:hypothetical protein [Prevotella pallens]MBF1517414.1 hypothetical protein [Prevotella pallens]
MKQNSTTNGENMVKRTERGWAGHFICSYRCYFRRNTLLEYEGKFIVVSTVGRMVVEYADHSAFDTVGCDRYYETMAFYSDTSDLKFHDIDVERQIHLDCDWALNEIDDNKANDMHEKAVDWVSRQMVEHNIIIQTM